MKTGIKVADAMTRNPVVVGPELSLRNCAITMLRNKVGSIIVKKDKKLIGLLTTNEFTRAIADNVDLDKVRVGDIMIRKVKTAQPDDDIYDALMRMGKKEVRRLPVVYKKEVIGILTINDVLKIQPRILDLLAEKFRTGLRFRPRTKDAIKYLEGECENCGNYDQLYDINGRLLCVNCKPSS